MNLHNHCRLVLWNISYIVAGEGERLAVAAGRMDYRVLASEEASS